MVNFGYPYNDIVICKDSTDYLRTVQRICYALSILNTTYLPYAITKALFF